MTNQETLKLALEALKDCRRDPRLKYEHKFHDKVIKALEEALKQEQELALQKLHDENERLGLYKDVYGEEHKESVRLQCVVCNTVYAKGVPPQVAKQEQDSTCNETLRAQGKVYPRTCKKCGFGPCIGKAKQEQGEPVALVTKVKIGGVLEGMLRKGVDAESLIGAKLYTTPQQRNPLTDEQIFEIWEKAMFINNGKNAVLNNQPFVHFARAIEAAHGIKGEV